MKLHIAVAGILPILWAASLLAQAPQKPAERRPNVLLIITDDQGSLDLNCYGSKDLQTPNMDSIATAGTRFTQFLANSPICSPSRAAILTGKYPPNAGLPDESASSARGGHGMPGEQVTIAEMFKASGYTTGHFGKWHLGFVTEEEPNAQGFDESLGFMSGCIDNYHHNFFYFKGWHDLWNNGKEIVREGEYFPDIITDGCTDFMAKNREKPFLIYYAINLPHYPVQGTAKWQEHYKDLPTPRREYAAAISTIDDHVGKLLAKLDELGLRENTIVCFMSDQGHSMEKDANRGGGNAGPYRGAKFSLLEGGVRVPAMISWKDHLPAGQVRNQVVLGCDWVPTLAELCKVDLPKTEKLDGLSMMPVVKSADAPTAHPIVYWQTERSEWSVRDGAWKLIGNLVDPTFKGPLPKEDTKLFLSNLDQDISERKNLAAEHPEVVQRLQKMHDEWVKTLPAHATVSEKNNKKK
ncbi:MAG: atsA 27 [Phycisphaerales bacterium]|nr:atsA 27 [Phycisphaerales bacterium]